METDTTAPQGSNLQIAIIGAAALIIAALIPVFLVRREKRINRQGMTPTPVEIELRRENSDRSEQATKYRAKITELENMLWKYGINPHTGRRK